MDNNIEIDKQTAKNIAKINGALVVIMLLSCFIEGGGIFSFMLAVFAALTNFILMIIYIAQGKTQSYIICIICMLLLPIIGFGCCASSLDGMKL